MVNVGDILYALYGATSGEVGVCRINGAINQAIIAIKPNNGYNSGFFVQWLKNQKHKIINTYLQGGQGNLSGSIVKDLTLTLPNSLKEQTHIGNLFKQLDNTIALHQEKVDTLEQMKRGFLQEMLPSKEKNVPKLRITNFTSIWTERRANSIFIPVSDKNYPNLPVLSASQEKGMIYRDNIGIDIKYDKKSTKTYKRVLPGQFVIHLRSFQGGFAYSNIGGITSPAYTILDFKDKKENSPLFWKYVLTNHNFIKRLEGVTYGIRDGRSISFKDFSILKFMVPSYDEQYKTGAFFKQIEDAITAHQNKTEKLQLLKKAYLQKMFI